MDAASFAVLALTLWVAHTVADHWIQTPHQALTKGDRSRAGQLACLRHVATYTATTAAFSGAVWAMFDLRITVAGFLAGQLLSAVTHYWADRRYTLARVAAAIGKTDYYDNGGAYQLDQSWHWFWLFVAALISVAGGAS